MRQAEISETLKRGAFEESPPRYFAEYEPVPPEWQPNSSNFPDGLLSLHRVTRSDGSDSVVSYWASEADFRRDGERFRNTMRGAAVVHEGQAGTPVTRRKKWYLRFLSFGWISTAIALAAGIDVLYHRYEQWFAAPELSIRPEVGAASELSAIEGELISLKADVRNPLTIELEQLKLAAELVPAPPRSTSHIPMVASESQIARLASGDEREVRFEVKGLPSGDWTVEINVSAKGGTFRSRKSFPASAKVKVWPRLREGPAVWVAFGASTGVLKGWIDVGVGAPDGMSCRVQIIEVSGLDNPRLSTGVKLLDKAWLSEVGVPGEEIYVQKWLTGPIGMKRRVEYELFVEAPPGTDWGAVTGKTTVKCALKSEGG